MLAFVCAVAGQVIGGVPEGDENVIQALRDWMSTHPIMHVAARRDVHSFSVFSSDATPYELYAVAFEPHGYAILNSDERLPLVVAFSPTSPLDLRDTPENAFRSMLQSHAAATAALLDQLSETDTLVRTEPIGTLELRIMGTEIYGPYLETTWNQNHPYNLYAQEDTVNPKEYYGGRVPAGCTPAAYAMVMNFHRWPLRGIGTHSYTDDQGDITGSHEADFTQPFAWDEMKLSYDPWTESQPGDTAVADLYYRLGVAAEADYESAGTSSSIAKLGRQTAKHLFYERPDHHTSQDALLPPLDADLTAGFPAVVTIPGHAIVADGLMIEGEEKHYHIDYGWGGQNNGWWTANNVAGFSLNSGDTSIRPTLMPFPVTASVNALEDEPFELHWLLPRRREDEAARLLLFEKTAQSAVWTHPANTFDHALPNRWEVRVGEGFDGGDCWFAGPGDQYAALTLEDFFVPSADTKLQFRMQYRLAAATFTVSISTDDGNTYEQVFSRNENWTLNWVTHEIDLGSYAGSELRILLELHVGSYYGDGGGVWIDDLTVTSGDWYRWELLVEDHTLANRRFSEERTLIDNCSDFSVFEKTSTHTHNWVIGEGETGGTSFQMVSTNIGYRTYHLTAHATISPSSSSRLLFRWKRKLADEWFRILVSSDRTTFTEVWSASGISDWETQVVSLADYAGQSVYVRLEYEMGGSYYTGDGGVWVDSIYMQDVINPEYEGQPVHYTAFDHFPTGTYTLAAAVQDQHHLIHPMSPAFALHVRPLFESHHDGESVTITAYHGTATQIEVPATLQGLPVTTLAAQAFDGVTASSMILPASITHLADGALSNLSGLSRIYFYGDAPAAGVGAFEGTSATLYYTADAFGWTDPFAGRPAVLWNAVIEPEDLGFDSPVSFRFRLTGPPAHQAFIESRDSLSEDAAPWQSLGVQTLDDGTAIFTDEAAGDAHFRVYRVRVPSLDGP